MGDYFSRRRLWIKAAWLGLALAAIEISTRPVLDVVCGFAIAVATMLVVDELMKDRREPGKPWQ